MGQKKAVLIFMFIGVFLLPAILVPLALRHGPIGLGIIAMTVMGMSLVLYTQIALRARSEKINPPEKRLFIIGWTMFAAGILTLLQQMLLN